MLQLRKIKKPKVLLIDKSQPTGMDDLEPITEEAVSVIAKYQNTSIELCNYVEKYQQTD